MGRLVAELVPATEFAAELMARLAELGVQHVVLSPGARSQALALSAAALEQRGDVQLHVRIDERVAGFVALGIARESGLPAAVITTSGSAVANLYPAVLEAHHAGVPLIVLTADRPEEDRGIGTNQTTDQHDIFGAAVRLGIDEPAPTHGSGTVRRASELATQAWQAATDAHAPGPVHLNLCFREPLSGATTVRALTPVTPPAPAQSAAELLLPRGPRTLVIAGADAGPRAEELAHAGGWPLIAEVTSGSRFGRNLVGAYRQLLNQPELVGQIQRIVVFGHPTLSREIPRVIGDTSTGIETIVVRGAATEGYNPGHNVAAFTNEVTVEPGAVDTEWLGLWMRASRTALAEQEATLAAQGGAALTAPNVEASRSESMDDRRQFIAAELAASRTPVTRELLVDALWRSTWPHDRLVFAASRLIRVADKLVTGKKIPVHANRGLAGIDGNISTAIGIALAAPAGTLTRVLVGDIATLHDAGALLLGEGEQRPRVQIVVGNDGGGTIFDSLEVAQTAPHSAMDRVFLTPQRVNLEALASAYGWTYRTAATVGELERVITGAGDGPELVEVKLER
ncbi:MAG: 2-succinyl-5-enolpyruvyl-6-hydroxy-3-cyclohexene-carboxylate synthase [Actinomycetota bacterium]